MPTPPSPDHLLQEAVDAFRTHGTKKQAADALGLPWTTLDNRLKAAAKRGMLLNDPAAWPGFAVVKESKTVRVDKDGNESSSQSVTQKLDSQGADFTVPPTHAVGKVTYQVSGDGKVERSWPRVSPDDSMRETAMRAAVAALKEDIPRSAPVPPPEHVADDLLNQYTVTDLHLGMMAWGEETGADWDLKIAERTLIDWFAAAIKQSPDAGTAVLCQLGDFLHHDAKASVTPASGHVLDADSRLQKMIRTAIRVLRQIVRMLLEKHANVHVVLAEGNHDEAGSAWMRELFAALYEIEPRVTVDTNPSPYYVVEHGATSLFFHHGHKRKGKDVDRVFAGKFREIYGRTKFSYAHTGHLHSDELLTTNLMKVERHETLAAPDAYAANGGWLSGRSAKVITYSKRFGEVGRITLSPEMVSR